VARTNLFRRESTEQGSHYHGQAKLVRATNPGDLAATGGLGREEKVKPCRYLWTHVYPLIRQISNTTGLAASGQAWLATSLFSFSQGKVAPYLMA